MRTTSYGKYCDTQATPQQNFPPDIKEVEGPIKESNPPEINGTHYDSADISRASSSIGENYPTC